MTTTNSFSPARVRRLLGRIPVWIGVAFLLVIVGYPLLWLLLGSFKTQREFLEEPTWAMPEQWNFDNYSVAWETAGLGQTFLNSAVAVLPSLFLMLLLGTAAAFALEVMVWKGRSNVLLIFLAGIMVPTQMILLPLFSAYFQIGLTGTLWTLIITYTATGLPLTVFLMATYFQSIPREIFEAATIDGASVIRQFFSIGLPMMKNGLFTVGLVQFFFFWNDLLIALTFANSGSIRTLQLGLLNFNGNFGTTQYGPLFAAVSINVFALLIVYLILNQRIQKGLTAGAVKG
ncbi:carbohydrate ABC transporter permease [Pseudoclavibacter sp. RFBG4]|uniref:carbohydrate ABC transporter permease n=1 Tax=unclassified Pseudoclavibacter TaxID=2615177 RepID=UPI000CE74372|nr:MULTISPECIES: carbohydrate ABC transporter permease [unclassified Pseudoclavibacter]MBF4460133.1 carbohydrate ABC transporter permease [Pseudoclavibacter sp. VKM Ac-2867]PPG26298.1 carbohydrate ABC transporter permease [Pseudoclavibacter sp. RFBG4]VXC01430.1 Carbohydrate ABC transporter permease [Pseudoclavibacter sp. 8L]